MVFSLILLITPLRHVNLFINQRLFVKFGGIAYAIIFPCSNVRIIVVVAFRFAIFGLVLFAKMSAARFVAVQGIGDQKFSKFHEICDATGAFQRRVKFIGIA